MQNILRKLIFATAIFLMFVAIVKCQSVTFGNQSSLPASETEPEWKFSFNTTFQSKLETNNKLPLIEAPVTFVSGKFTKTDRYGVTQLQSNLGLSSRRNEAQHYYGVKLSRTQNLNQTLDLNVGGSYHFTRNRRFATVYSSLNAKVLGPEKNTTSSGPQLTHSELFAKVEYFTPTESGLQLHKGFTVSGGWDNQFQVGRIWLQPSVQYIWDHGALEKGQRKIGNIDFTIGYQFNKLCIGGGLDYSRFFSGRPNERNSLVGKVFVRYN